MQTTIYLIRHGEIDNPDNVLYGRAIDLHLNKVGEEQLRKLSEKLKKRNVHPVTIYTSPLTRAVQSSKLLQQIFNVPIVQDEHFLEVNHPGLEKYTLDWYATIGEDIYTYTGKEVEGIPIEMPEEQAKRMIDGIKKIQRKYPGQTVFIVSHGDPIAFTHYKLLHPHDYLSGRKDFLALKNNIYPGKGTAIRLVLDNAAKVIEDERIIP